MLSRWLLSLLTLSTAAASQPCVVQLSTDFPHDEGSSEQAPTSADCCQRCWAQPSCVVGVHLNGVCYLKRNATKAVPADNRTACFPQRGGVVGVWPPPPSAVASTLGSMHQGGCYYNKSSPGTPFMLDGARAVARTGSRVLKLAAIPLAMHTSYPWNSQWPADGFADLVSVLQHPYVNATLHMDEFDTVVFTAYSSVGASDNNYWRTSISSEQAAMETLQFDAAASYLATAFPPSKTFVLSHWEGDWSARGQYNTSIPVSHTAASGMIRWLAARQAGVDAAMARLGGAVSANVLHCSEVNLVASTINSPLTAHNIITAVIPHVRLDLVSYSSYDTLHTPLFRRALETIAAHHNRTRRSPPVAVAVGEFGVPLMQVDNATVVSAISNVVQNGLAFGCPFLAFWEVYGNELAAPSGGRGPRCTSPVFNTTALRGFWLFGPDGTPSWPAQYFQSLTHT